MTPETLTALIDGTWPAKSVDALAGWTIRTGAGGGSRVSCASQNNPTAKISVAEAAMRTLHQTPIFMVRHGEDLLDRALAGQGYAIKDPVTYYTCPIEHLTRQRPPAVSCFEVWPPLAVQIEIWAAGGIDAPRLAIMERAKGPKTALLGRAHNAPAGTAFTALHERSAMLHAIETAKSYRRQGVARHMITGAAFWAQDNGADTITLLVTTANAAANTLYTSMGFSAAGGYHYRIHPEAT